MASSSSYPQAKKKKAGQFPPRRGQVKAQIFESIVKTIVSAATKAKGTKGKAVMERAVPLQLQLRLKVAITLKKMATYLRGKNNNNHFSFQGSQFSEFEIHDS